MKAKDTKERNCCIFLDYWINTSWTIDRTGVMLVCRRPLILPLLLIISLLNLSFVTSSSSRNATRPRSHIPGDDYYSNYDEITNEPPSSSTTDSNVEPTPCIYDMCVEQQQTCFDIATLSGCLCPGLSGPENPPGPPEILKVSREDSAGVLVQWCAPTSVVTHYNIWVEGKDKAMKMKLEVAERKRTALLSDVTAGVNVCVEAVNDAGVSARESKSCTKFEPQRSDSGLALKLGIIGGVVGLILLLVLALLLWRHKTRRKSTQTERTTEGVL